MTAGESERLGIEAGVRAVVVCCGVVRCGGVCDQC